MNNPIESSTIYSSGKPDRKKPLTPSPIPPGGHEAPPAASRDEEIPSVDFWVDLVTSLRRKLKEKDEGNGPNLE